MLALARDDQRILVTHNVSDFPPILLDWAASVRSRAGVILVYGINHSEFGLIVCGVERWLERRSTESDWVDFTAVVDRAFAGH